MGQFEGSQFIVSEFVEGMTLREKLAGGRLDVDSALDIAIQVATGLVAAHAAGLEHRDVKPENIILRNDGLVKIVDFGIAKLSRETGAGRTAGRPVSATVPGVVLGTARYMSPEQARGLPSGPATDVFSLGVVLYEMLAGKPPFEGPTTSDVIAGILKAEPQSLSQLAPETPPGLCDIVLHAIRKDVESRCRAVGMLAGLRTLRREREFRAQFGVRRGAPRRRSRMILLFALVLLVAAGAYLLWSRLAGRPRLAVWPFCRFAT